LGPDLGIAALGEWPRTRRSLGRSFADFARKGNSPSTEIGGIARADEGPKVGACGTTRTYNAPDRKKTMQGLHLTADLYDCRSSPALLSDAAVLRALCLEAVESAGLQAVGDRFHRFPDFEGHAGGVTGMVLLAESHVALHTWPERDEVTLDVYVCNFLSDNSSKAQALLDGLVGHFKPSRLSQQRICRGETVSPPSDAASGEAHEAAVPRGWHDEALNADSRYGYRLGRLLHAEQSPFQRIEVYESEQFGRVFLLDGDYMTSERDEYFYHEAMIHPAGIAIGNPRSALILGGGDGGSCEELLKYPGMQRIVIAEIDEAVVRMARRFLGAVHRGALDDPRVEVCIGDGFEWARRSRERFDLVILDLTDPDTPASPLYSEAFFADVGRLLQPLGALVLHTGTPIFAPSLVAQLHARLRRHFKVVAPLGLYIPLYGSYWTLAVCSQASDPRRVGTAVIRERIAQLKGPALGYYNAEIHPALFALPNDLRALLADRDGGDTAHNELQRPAPVRRFASANRS